MTTRTRKLAVILSIASLGTAAAGAGVAAQAATSKKTNGARQHRGPSAAERAALAAKLGVTTAQLQAAMKSIRPAKPTPTAKDDKGAGRAAALATILGVDTAKVQAILDANRPARPAAGTAKPTGKPDESALIKALADGLGLDEATVTAALEKEHAAHEADHKAREAKMAAALAKALNLDTATVQAALDAVRPARPKG